MLQVHVHTQKIHRDQIHVFKLEFTLSDFGS